MLYENKHIFRKLIPFFLLTVISGHVQAFYMRIFLDELIGNSDLIITGKIIEVSERNFNFKIDQVVKGDVEDESLTIMKFMDWTCAKRWIPYEIDQELLLFIRIHRVPDTTIYTIRGAGDEGEMPIQDQNVYVFYDDQSFPAHTIWGRTKYGYEFNLSDFISAIHEALVCFHFIPKKESPYSGFEEIITNCTESDIEQIKDISESHRYIFSQINFFNRRKIKFPDPD
jgi:hypothetical protein